MTLYEELKARGLVAQITDDEIIDLINNGKATFYIGFDCTADSLTAGHFMALTLMKRLQMAGNRPIALIGGGTTMIGDPSGRTDMRKMLTKEDIAHNAACFKKQMEKFIDFSDGKALMLNNADWLLNLNYVELLRDVGACFSVNNMLRARRHRPTSAANFWSLHKACIRTPDGQNGVFTMYGVSKINIEPSLMMISVQDAEFKGNTMARYLQIFADTGVVVDMIIQQRPAAGHEGHLCGKSGQGRQGFSPHQRGILQAESLR